MKTVSEISVKYSSDNTDVAKQSCVTKGTCLGMTAEIPDLWALK